MDNNVDPTTTATGIGTVGAAIVAIISSIKYFASSADLEKLRSECADKFLTKTDANDKFVEKEDLEKLEEDIKYIRTRIDAFLDRQNSNKE